MKCLKNKRLLRAISLISALALSAAAFASCGEKEKAEASQTTAEADTVAPETTSPEESTAIDFDFEKAVIADYVIGSIGDTLTIENLPEANSVFSHPRVAEMKDGKFFAKSAGVTLVGFEGADTAYAVCVLPQGVYEEKSAGRPHLLEVGKTYFVEGFGSSDSFSTSNEEVIALDGITAQAVGTGYAVVDASNASMPRLFAFLVFDRTVG